MDAKILKILSPCIAGILGLMIGFAIGSTRTSNRFLEQQKEIEQKRKELERAQVDSIYLCSNVVWEKQELKSQVYSMMFDDIQFANIDNLKKHKALNNPYWQEINTLFNKLSPYCTERIQRTLKSNSSQNRVHLSLLYNDLQKVRTDVIKEISGIDAQPDTSADRRLRRLEEKDLIYLQNNNIWDKDSIWSQKYANFMIGMRSGNIKVFTHSEINNKLWQEILSYEINSKRISELKEIILKASNKQNVDITELYAIITEGTSTFLKIGKKQIKDINNKQSKDNYNKADDLHSADRF